MKYTVLEMTQSVLSSLGSDEVNSIGDTTESMQVAEILRQSYFNFIQDIEIPEQNQLIQLQPSLNVDIPVLMYVPDHVAKVKWLKYFNTNQFSDSTGGHGINVDIVPSDPTTSPLPGYQYVDIIPMQEFLNLTNGFNPSETDVLSFDISFNDIPGNFTFYYKNQKQPQFCTIIANKYVIFDGYDSTQDSTLQASKTMAEGSIKPVFLLEDSFIPSLNDEQFPILLNEAKSLAFFELKQSAHPLAEKQIKRAMKAVQRDKAVADVPSAFDQLPDFGKRPFVGVSYFKSRGWDRP